MLIGTECVQISKQQVRAYILPILNILFRAQVALALKDRESKNIADKENRKYDLLCYWDARERFDPFVEYIAHIVVELTTGWFWPEKRDADQDGKDVDLTEEHVVPCGFATYYHEEIATKILGHTDNVREYFEGTPLESTWKKFDRQIRESIAEYQKLVEIAERYSYGLVKVMKKSKKGKKQ